MFELQARARALVNVDRSIDLEAMPLRRQIATCGRYHRALARGPKPGQLLAAVGENHVGRLWTLSDSIFGWQPDRVAVTSRGGYVHALHCFGALPGDGVDDWLFLFVDRQCVAFGAGTDYSFDHIEVHANQAGPLLAAVEAGLEAALAEG